MKVKRDTCKSCAWWSKFDRYCANRERRSAPTESCKDFERDT